jgi:hypothetical protein
MTATSISVFLCFVIGITLSLLAYSVIQNILCKADSHSACQTIVCFLYGTRMFITVLTKPRHWTLSWARRIQFAPSITFFLRSILILFSHLRLGLPSGLFPSNLPTKTPSTPLPSPHACYTSRPPHPPWFNHPNNIRWRIQAVNFIMMQFSPLSVFLPFRSKYPQNPLLKNPQSTLIFLPQC